ncbi:paREP5 [Pyrobaculum oguniense TE7]|uniref:PaREP5 n=1 Tax=Pyrobaculum oguniense (strain DSM 13380 / JCM 10595 / TE7) TaxID=698757 RepID=H6QA89_PYROT|nr:paREP5 [Pyrobaculum oguniense TE7]
MSEIVWATIGTSLTVIGMLGGALYWLGGKFKEVEERFKQIDERFTGGGEV